MIQRMSALVPRVYEWRETAKFRARLIANLQSQQQQEVPEVQEMEIEPFKTSDEDDAEEVQVSRQEEIFMKERETRLVDFGNQIAKGETLKRLFQKCKDENDVEGITVLAENQESLKKLEKLGIDFFEIILEKYTLHFSDPYECEEYKENGYPKEEGTWKDRFNAIKKNQNKIRHLMALGWNPVALIDMVEDGGYKMEEIEEKFIEKIADEREKEVG